MGLLVHGTIPPRHDSLMTLYDGYCSDSFSITFQSMYAVMACLISNIIAGKPHILSALVVRSCEMSGESTSIGDGS